MGNLKTYLMATTAAVFWGANFNLAKPVVAEMSPYVAGASRYVLAAAIMLLIAFVQQASIPLRHLKTYVTLGVVGVFGFNLFFFLGMETTSAVNGALIMALNPLLTAVLAYLIMHDKPTKRQMIAFPFGILGVAIVVLGGGARLHIAIGDFYILIANLSWALYNVLLRTMMPKGVSGVASTAGIMTVGALALSMVALLHGDHAVWPSMTTAISLIIMAVGGGVLAYLCWNASIATLGASKAAMYMNLVPVTSMLIATLAGIPPSPTQLIGALLVMGAVTYSSFSQTTTAQKDPRS